jgi:hypothetical protein
MRCILFFAALCVGIAKELLEPGAYQITQDSPWKIYEVAPFADARSLLDDVQIRFLSVELRYSKTKSAILPDPILSLRAG